MIWSAIISGNCTRHTAALSTGKYTRAELDALSDETDWESVVAVTDKAIDAAASSEMNE